MVFSISYNSGDTPLHLATSWGYSAIVQLLIEYGASVWAKNNQRQTPAGCTDNYIILEMLSRQFNDHGGFDSPQVWYKAPVTSEQRGATGEGNLKDVQKQNSPYMQMDKKYYKEVDRLFKAILQGDDNLACFYLNIFPASSKSGVSGLTKVKKLTKDDSLDVPVLEAKSATSQCHPLCDCDKCSTGNNNNTIPDVRK